MCQILVLGDIILCLFRHINGIMVELQIQLRHLGRCYVKKLRT